ncbi:MAG: GatB/YqeY domain-containing protein [Candidatus Dadabacteria bacterium]|nr:MAG: GatB/YqeY domain-containing protein [Candidatus Dadabacteria bacterium]
MALTKEEIRKEIADALKKKEKVRADTLRMLLSAVQYQEMQKKVDNLSEAEVLKIVQNEVKKREESISFAKEGGREDLVQTLKEEIKVLTAFLPQQLSDEELQEVIKNFCQKNQGAKIGDVMRFLSQEYAGRFDGRKASSIAREILG